MAERPWMALVPAECLALILAHNGRCKTVWVPVEMVDDTPMLNEYLPAQAQRMLAEIREDER